MSVERDVTVRLRVRREDGQAFADIARRARETEQALVRTSRLLTAAAAGAARQVQWTPGMAGPRSGGGGPGGGDQQGGLATAARIWATVHGAERNLEFLGKSFKTLGDEALTSKQKVQGLLEAIPLLGGVAKQTRTFIEEITGQAGARRKDLKGAEQATLENSLDDVARQRGDQATAFGSSLTGGSLLEDKARALKRVAEAQREVNATILPFNPANPSIQSITNLTKHNLALADAVKAREKLLEVIGREGQVQAGRVEAARQFASLPDVEQLAAVQAAKRAEQSGLGAISREEQELLRRTDLFRPLVDREAAKEAMRNPILPEAMAINARVVLDSTEVARVLARELGPLMGAVIKEFGVESGKVAQQQQQVIRGHDQVRKSMAQFYSP